MRFIWSSIPCASFDREREETEKWTENSTKSTPEREREREIAGEERKRSWKRWLFFPLFLPSPSAPPRRPLPSPERNQKFSHLYTPSQAEA